MSDLSIIPFFVGNGFRLSVDPLPGAWSWRVLRKATKDIAGVDDPDALVVYSGQASECVDLDGVVTGSVYFYRAFYRIGDYWTGGETVPVVSVSMLNTSGSVDVLSLVRNRLDLGLHVILESGVLSHRQGHIPVLTAPPLFEDTAWPLVTVHLNQDSSSERGLGEILFSESEHSEGWLSAVSLTIVSWALNPDERLALRVAIKHVLLGNLPVFDALGLLRVDIQQSDTEDFQSYSAPIYQTTTSFNCLAPSIVRNSDAGTSAGDFSIQIEANHGR